ncbi:vWA domain-containing protein [Emticicia sp. 21SJ11W-3]|uniref:vWA domain-containing protein n=1 Tax=Emticicia sp. 21SJ11W-3 TaxID=2916755 RepID=UPI0020A05A29|nr:vWA domain-containing protein [Emticicia sp. 21SJ11W-3]UTA66230.1 VWA domain-containing protein [Emticicia sp. 21SJ11W-3]
MKSELIFQSSPWFILLCLLAGGIYSFLLYQKKSNFTTLQNRLLAVARGILVALLAFLLVNPLLRSNKTSIEKPTVVLAVDNSASMAKGGEEKINALKDNLQKLIKAIESKGNNVEIKTLSETELNDDINSLKFNEKTTDLSGLLAGIKNNYEGRNLTDVILVSDGIANSGVSPTYGKYNFNVHTIGLGDTTLRRDVKLNAIYANRIAYLGNKFPVQAEISSYGYTGKTTSVLLKHGGKIIDRQTVSFDMHTDLKQITFYGNAEQKGLQRYTIEMVPLNGEFTVRNNARDVYIDVVDGKEKILLVALAPHPDIKAIRAIIEKNELYELTVKVLQSDNINEIGTQPFDVLILHQLPDLYGAGGNLLNRLMAQAKPTLFILGNQSNIAGFNGIQQTLSILAQAGRADKVSAKFNSSFNLFNLDGDKLSILEKLPPLLAPFGEYRAGTGSEIILYQRVGAVVTPKPLLIANTANARKSAVLTAEGIWQWRLEEFALTDKQEIVDEVFMKTLQLISIKDDKRKLRVYPVSREFSVDEKVVFENEAYNDIYERIYNQSIRLEITDEKGATKSYNYTISQDNTRFEISGLGEGVYRYKAATQVLGKSEEVSGQFVVQNTDLEDLTHTADFNLLRTLAQQNKGKFYEAGRLNNLTEYLSTNQSPDKISSIEEMNEFINLKWVFFLLLALASVEWVSRKYLGTY